MTEQDWIFHFSYFSFPNLKSEFHWALKFPHTLVNNGLLEKMLKWKKKLFLKFARCTPYVKKTEEYMKTSRIKIIHFIPCSNICIFIMSNMHKTGSYENDYLVPIFHIWINLQFWTEYNNLNTKLQSDNIFCRKYFLANLDYYIVLGVLYNF